MTSEIEKLKNENRFLRDEISRLDKALSTERTYTGDLERTVRCAEKNEKEAIGKYEKLVNRFRDFIPELEAAFGEVKYR